MSTTTRFVSLCAYFLICLFSISFAQTYSDLVKADPKEQYAAIRDTMQHFYDAGGLRSTIEGQGEYDLWNCHEPFDFLGDTFNYKTQDPLPLLMNVAATVVIWRNDFRKLGIPEDVWASVVKDYENKQVESIAHRRRELDREQDEAKKKQVATVLNRFGRETNSSIPQFVVEGGCGAGEVSVRVALRPPNGRVLFIPAFSYELCRKQHLNPDDPESCNRWTEAIEGLVMYVSGDYRYTASWPDGTARKGRLGFNSPDQEGTTLVIEKPR